jgi:hypothetical protein
MLQCICFKIFIFKNEFLILVQSSGPLRFMFGCRFWVSIWFGRRLAQDFGGFFSSNKRVPAHRERELYTSRHLKNEGDY